MLGNANNDANAGSLYLNGNNAVSDANANWGAFLNKTYTNKGVSQTQRSNIAEMAAHEGERPTCREVFADTHQAHQDPAQDPAKTPFSYPQKNPSYA